MGGVAIVGGAFVGYLVAHIRTEAIKFADAGIALLGVIVGLSAVGFVDDYLGVRKARNLGLRKRGKTGGDRDRRRWLRVPRAPSSSACRRTCRSRARSARPR